MGGFGLQEPRGRAWYGERARGGAGTIITGAKTPRLFDDSWGHPGGVGGFIERVSLLTKEVHEAGARIGLQLLMFNRWPDGGGEAAIAGGEAVGPSARIEGDPATISLFPGERVREVTIEEIETIIARFAMAAAGAREAGFDFVELHLTHGYFTCQFFSPFYNRRKDRYGGDLKGRMRFGLECATAMRRAVGDDFPLFCRLGAEDRTPGGINLRDSLEFGCELVKAGVDVLDIDPAESTPYCSPFATYPMGTFVHQAAAFKHVVDVPVITAGRIHKPEVAEAILQRGQADLVAIGRQLIADPFWPQKVKEGRTDDIVPCLSCNQCLAGRQYFCSVNAAAGQEEDFRIKPVQESKRVWVVGGGPGGMGAARVAALRGHKVVLFERESRLGGQLPIAAALPEKWAISDLQAYLVRQVEKAGVEVRLNSEATAAAVIEGNPDAVILATGSTPFVPDIPGISGDNVVLAEDVLARRREVGDTVAIIGGGLVACDAALFLAEQGKRVTMTEILPVIVENEIPSHRLHFLTNLVARGVAMLTSVKYERVTPKGLDIIDKEGNRRVIEADTVVLAAGSRPNSGLARELEGRVRVCSVGDCVEPRLIMEAINEGARMGLEV